MKVLIGKSLIKCLLNVQRALNLSLSTSNCYIATYQLTLFLKKLDLEMMISALSVILGNRKFDTPAFSGDAKNKRILG